jgi:hypothetical protein
LSLAAVSKADVTVEEKTTFDLAFFKANSTTIEQYTADKKHRSSQFRCEGIMSMLCGKNDTGEIVRLDKSTTYELEPKKKQYREQPFPTAAERAELKRRMAETMEKMKQCAAQAPAAKPAVDPSKCQMSPPKLEVTSLGDEGQILGHDVHHAVVSLTQSCTNKETGDVCDMQFGFDLWLTADKIPGLADRLAFEKAHLAKLGLVGEGGVVSQQQVQTALAPYAEQMKQLRAKMGDLKGQALRTAFNMSYGGPHCGSANKSQSGPSGGESGQGPAGAGAGAMVPPVGGGSLKDMAIAQVGTKLLSGFLAKRKQKQEATEAANAPAAQPQSPGMVSMVKFSTETTGIRTDPIPADQFEIPAGWTKVVPKGEGKEEPFECPKQGRAE